MIRNPQITLPLLLLELLGIELCKPQPFCSTLLSFHNQLLGTLP